MLDARSLVGSHDVLLVTLDTLRFDVAQSLAESGKTPVLSSVLPDGKWEPRHSPGSFTYSAHAAFFAGFLPTPVAPGKHPRLFAVAFPGAETITERTCVFDSPNLVEGFRSRGYRTICVGGVGFFNRQSPLGSIFPNLFDESYWSPELGVTAPRSIEAQVEIASRRLKDINPAQRVFLFLNVSAIHQPNRFYLKDAEADSLESHAAALVYVDRHLERLFDALGRRAPAICVLCSDHGTAYGEDGYFGHRLAHPVIWTVPYAEFVLPRREAT
jgi:hypothetical protein